MSSLALPLRLTLAALLAVSAALPSRVVLVVRSVPSVAVSVRV